MGNTLTDLGRYSEAIDYFTRTLAIEHDYVEGYINRGVAYWYLQKYDEALPDFTRATRYARLQVQARNNKALAELALDRKEEALRTINELLDNPRGGDIAPALNTKGSILYQMGKYDEALSIFNEAIRKFGEQAEYCYNRGLVYHKQKKYDLAITDYDRAISKNPSFAEAYSNRPLHMQIRESSLRQLQMHIRQLN